MRPNKRRFCATRLYLRVKTRDAAAPDTALRNTAGPIGSPRLTR